MTSYNYLIESSDSKSLKIKIEEIIKKTNFLDVPISNYDVVEDEFDRALEDLDTYGLFSNKKVVVINNIESFSIDSNKDLYKHFMTYLDNTVSDNLLIVTSKKLNNTKKLTKDLKKKLEYILVSINPENYIKQKLSDYKLENGVVKKIHELCLDDITKIDNECNKLINFKANEKEISLSDISLMVIKKHADSMDLTFDFVRNLASKNKSNALKKYRELVDNYVDSISLLGLLGSQFRIIYQTKILSKRNMSSNEIASVLAEKPYRITKTLELTKYYSEAELLSLMQRLANIDLKMKTSDVDNKFLIELFILNYC